MSTITTYSPITKTPILRYTSGANPGVATKLNEIINLINGSLGTDNISDIYLLNSGDQSTGDISIKTDAPGLRFIGTEGSAEDLKISEDSGSLLIQKNTGSEVSPSWSTIVEIDIGADSITVDGQTTKDIPSGEIILFYKDTAVEGYSLLTSVDDKAVYITKGSAAGGETGGGLHSTGSWTISGITVDSHTHGPGSFSGPSHTHTVDIYADDFTGSILSHGTGSYTYIETSADDASWKNTEYLPALSGGKGKRETTASDGSGSVTGTSATASSSSITSTGAWRPAAACFTMQERD